MRSRRDALKLFAVATATAGVAGSLTVNPVSSNERRNYVLVHGAWVGGWIWRRVSDQLAIAGHRVYAPSLTGLGDRQHLLTRETNMDTHIRDIIALIEMEELRDVILVGNSYGGIVTTGVAAKVPQHLKQLVYLDAILVEDGESWSSVHAADIVAARRKAAQESSAGLTLPVPKSGINDPGDAAWVERRMTPHPFSTYEQKMHWGGAIGGGVPKVYIDCTQPALTAIAAMKNKYRGRADWPFIEIKTGHIAQVTAAKEVTELLLRFA
jgi:pimeloyl-ACP methyl ester carboxylesterase